MVLNGYPFWLEFKPSGSLLVTHARAGGAESEGGTESSRSFGRWGNRKKTRLKLRKPCCSFKMTSRTRRSPDVSVNFP